MADIRKKQGDTFLVNGVYRDRSQNPVNLTSAGITITSAVLSEDGSERYEIDVAISNQGQSLGGFVLRGDTTTWTPGRCLRWDVRFDTDDTSMSTERTYTIQLDERVS